MRKSTTRAGLVAALLCTFACGGSRTPLQPDEPIQALTGTWAGLVTESPGERDGTLRLMLWQVDAGLWGTFALEFPDASFNRAGRVDGLDLATPFLTGVTNPEPGCDTPLSSTLITLTWVRTGDTLSGTYNGYACFGLVSGSFTLALQR